LLILVRKEGARLHYLVLRHWLIILTPTNGWEEGLFPGGQVAGRAL